MKRNVSYMVTYACGTFSNTTVNIVVNTVTKTLKVTIVMDSKGNILRDLFYVDALCVALPFAYRVCTMASKKQANKLYGEWYDIRSWTVRVLHYLTIATVGSLLLRIAVVNYYAYILCHVLLLSNSIPIIQNMLVRTQGGKRYYMLLNKCHNDAFRFIVLLGVSQIIRDNVMCQEMRNKITIVNLLARLQLNHLKRFSFNTIVLYILQLMRSKNNTYLYYKICKYLFRYNYSYNYKVLSQEKALSNLTKVLQEQSWDNLSEPLFIHSLLTLETTKVKSDCRFQSMFFIVNKVFSLWTFMEANPYSALTIPFFYKDNIIVRTVLAITVLQLTQSPLCASIVTALPKGMYKLDQLMYTISLLHERPIEQDFVSINERLVSDDEFAVLYID
jgi:hypothetical protein